MVGDERDWSASTAGPIQIPLREEIVRIEVCLLCLYFVACYIGHIGIEMCRSIALKSSEKSRLFKKSEEIPECKRKAGTYRKHKEQGKGRSDFDHDKSHKKKGKILEIVLTRKSRSSSSISISENGKVRNVITMVRVILMVKLVVEKEKFQRIRKGIYKISRIPRKF